MMYNFYFNQNQIADCFCSHTLAYRHIIHMFVTTTKSSYRCKALQ